MLWKLRNLETKTNERFLTEEKKWATHGALFNKIAKYFNILIILKPTTSSYFSLIQTYKIQPLSLSFFFVGYLRQIVGGVEDSWCFINIIISRNQIELYYILVFTTKNSLQYFTTQLKIPIMVNI